MTIPRRVSPFSSASGCWLNGSGGAAPGAAPGRPGVGGTAGTPPFAPVSVLGLTSGVVGNGSSGPIRHGPTPNGVGDAAVFDKLDVYGQLRAGHFGYLSGGARPCSTL